MTGLYVSAPDDSNILVRREKTCNFGIADPGAEKIS